MLFLNRLAGDNMSLRGPADLVELVSNQASSGIRSQRTESSFDPFIAHTQADQNAVHGQRPHIAGLSRRLTFPGQPPVGPAG
jgi:hypothetical protein